MSVEDALAAALESTPRLPRDEAVVQLALRYAETLDDSFRALAFRVPAEDGERDDGAARARTVLEISRLGARLEATLDRLGMTPGARPAVRGDGGEGADPARGALERLRADAAAGAPTAGVDYTEAVDPAVTEADAED